MATYIPSITLPEKVFTSPAIAILLPIALGTAVGYSTRPKQTQATYMRIKQPPLRPPPWLFGPVWTLLYGIMGYASHIAYTSATASPLTTPPSILEAARRGNTLYTVQLGLNLLWMPLFFGMGRPAEALGDIVLLSGCVGWLAWIWGVEGVSETAGWLMVPYLAWLGFATYLNAGVGVLNGWKIYEKVGEEKEE